MCVSTGAAGWRKRQLVGEFTYTVFRKMVITVILDVQKSQILDLG